VAGSTVLRLSIFGTFRAADASGTDIPIKSRKSRALLAYLALPPGKPRSREHVMALLWSDRSDQQARSSLRQALSGLRKDIGEERLSALLITDESLTLDPACVIVEPASPGDVLLDGLHVTDPAFEEWLRDERLRHEEAAVPHTHPPEPPLSDKPSIVVLPFVNMSGDPEQEYFADGITEDVITELSRFRALNVIARNSSFFYKGKSTKVQEVGRELGVAYVVEGSVRKAKNRIRVAAQLVDSESGNHLWADRYDRDLEDIFAVQDDLTRTIVSTVAGRIEVVGHRRASRTSADSLEAYDLVLRARRHCYAFTKPDNAEAKKLLERAIALDPLNARTHAALANCHHLDWISHWAAVGDESLNEAHRLAKRAVELDGTDSYAQWTLGCTCMFERRYQNSRLHVERALELNPNDVEARALYGMILTNIGETNEAMAAYRDAELVDPHHLSWMPWYWGWTYFTVSRFNEAIEALERIEQPHLEILALLAASYAYVGRSKKAGRALNSLLSVAENEMVDFPGRSATAWARDWNTLQSYKDDAIREVLAVGLRKAGLDP
jgi:adenylate cyclase